MLAAIIAAIVAGIAVIAAVLVVMYLCSNSEKSKVQKSGRSVTLMNNVGVSSTLENVTGGSTHVATDHSPSGNPAETLKGRFRFMGIFAAAVFGSLGIKAFTMQVLNAKQYASRSNENQYSTVLTPAPRGYILDAQGLPLVKNRSSLTVLADADVADDKDVVARLSAVLGIPRNVIRMRIKDTSSGAQSQRVVASDVRQRDIAFIAEHNDAFSGITFETRAVREYPYGALAAHVLGYTGAASEDDFEFMPEGRNIQSGDTVGQSGVEAYYDNLLAGEHGIRKVIADAEGNVREVASVTQPTKGSDILLTIKAPVQYRTDQLLAECIAPENGVVGTGKGVAGAIVVMDVQTGGIIALSNYPTYSPESFVGGISDETWAIYNNSDPARSMMINRAISGTYPAASTYKAFTGLAGLQYGFVVRPDPSYNPNATFTRNPSWTEAEAAAAAAAFEKEHASHDSAGNRYITWNCEGTWDGFGSGDWQNCWETSGHGELDLHDGIVHSCDVVFYEIAKEFFYSGKTAGGTIDDTAMQDVIKKYGFGKKTGIDLSGEVTGRVPTPEWKAEYFKDVPEEASWRGGDLTNMVIGQGYVLITPIQLAVAYGAIATGNIVQPHLLKEVRNSAGETAFSYETKVLGTPDVNPEHLAYIRSALRGVATDNATLDTRFTELGIQAACKTGTAEVAGKNDYAWFACYAPYDNPKYVAVCVIEEGGGGSDTASPIGSYALAAALEADENYAMMGVGRIASATGEFKEIDRSSTTRTD